MSEDPEGKAILKPQFSMDKREDQSFPVNHHFRWLLGIPYSSSKHSPVQKEKS